jgi:enterobactin synthetase component D
MSDPARLAALTNRVAALFPSSVAVGAAWPCDPDLLPPAERAAIAQAIPSRQREFAGGRMAARMALEKLGFQDQPLPVGPGRAPVWPSGIVGSITHAAGLCLAAVTPDTAVKAMGLDLEPDDPLPTDAEAEVVLPVEQHLPGRLVFSAKEAVFKALYPAVGHYFGFDAVQVALSARGFRATTLVPLGPIPAGASFVGQFWRGDGVILTALLVSSWGLPCASHRAAASPVQRPVARHPVSR